MPGLIARTASTPIILKSAARITLAASLIVIGSDSVQNAVANGDTRTISFRHMHTDEDLTVTYKRNGRYDDAALKKINHIMRDWRRNEEVAMDPQLIDLVWEVQREVRSTGAIHVVCGYRAPGTNEMLRKRSRNSGVARFSQHTQGKAMDFYIPGAPIDDWRAGGLRLQRGGVGFYPTSGSPFVHLDVGSVRHWPRMTHDQLAKVFPDGRTVHVPTDGKPLAGYAVAMAELEKRGGDVPAARIAAPAKRNIFAKLFGFGKDRDEEEDAEATLQQVAEIAPKAAPAPVAPIRPMPVAVEQQKAAPVAVANIPLPRSRAVPAQVAMAEPAAPLPVRRPAQAASLYTLAEAPRPPAPIPNTGFAQPENVFDSRGFWRGTPDAVVSSDTKVEVASADAKATGSIGPWPAPPERATPSAGEAAIGYAPPSAEKVVKQAPMGAAIPRATAIAAGNGISIAMKGSAEPAAAEPAAGTSRPAMSFDNPWLRAMVLAPSVNTITTMVFGALDMRTLQPLMRRPATAVAMSFSADPHGGMRTDSFTGNAIVFVATTTFVGRTAALQ